MNILASQIKPRDHVIVRGTDVVIDRVVHRGARVALGGLNTSGAGWIGEVSADEQVEVIAPKVVQVEPKLKARPVPKKQTVPY